MRACKECSFFQRESGKPSFGWCSKKEWYISLQLAETQALCEKPSSVTQVTRRKKPRENGKTDRRAASIQTIRCGKCGEKMLPRADGARLFYTVAFLCPKCLHEVKLKKPIYHPPNLNRQTRKPSPEALEKFKEKLRQVEGKVH